MKTLVMSDEYPCFCRALEQQGYKIIPTENIEVFLKPERRHADMQLLAIGDKVFTLADCKEPIRAQYPGNVRLNCLYLGGRLYGKLSATASAVLDYCRRHDIECVNVNQGYTRCSTLVLSDCAAITADKSIERALQSNGVEVLLISAGHIRLEGFDYGFIGGAGFADEGVVRFFGNVKKHPDYEKIKVFCEKYDSKIEILCPEEPLTDLGGRVPRRSVRE